MNYNGEANHYPFQLDDRYRELQGRSKTLHRVWNSFVARRPLFCQHLDSSQLHNWALNSLQYKHDIQKDIREQYIQILLQRNLTLKIEKTVKLNNLVHHSLSLSPPDMSGQSLQPPFLTSERIHKYDR